MKEKNTELELLVVTHISEIKSQNYEIESLNYYYIVDFYLIIITFFSSFLLIMAISNIFQLFCLIVIYHGDIFFHWWKLTSITVKYVYMWIFWFKLLLVFLFCCSMRWELSYMSLQPHEWTQQPHKWVVPDSEHARLFTDIKFVDLIVEMQSVRWRLVVSQRK